MSSMAGACTSLQRRCPRSSKSLQFNARAGRPLLCLPARAFYEGRKSAHPFLRRVAVPPGDVLEFGDLPGLEPLAHLAPLLDGVEDVLVVRLEEGWTVPSRAHRMIQRRCTSRRFASPASATGCCPQTAPRPTVVRRPDPDHEDGRRRSYDDGSHQRHHEQSTLNRGREL